MFCVQIIEDENKADDIDISEFLEKKFLVDYKEKTLKFRYVPADRISKNYLESYEL